MAPSHGVICVIIVVLLVLQGALYAHRSSWIIAQPEIAAPAAAEELAPPVRNQMHRARVADAEVLSAAEFLQQTMAKPSYAPPASNQSRHASGKDCGESTGTFPRNRILIIHEQHLQSMGCDVRLLRFVKDLVYLNQEVSMLFRGSTPAKMRQPKSKQLASILHIENFEEDQLRKGLREPPGLYEWTSSERFAQLMAKGYFNVVIIFLWFWYDPQPSVAELVLPVLRAHSPEDRQPFVALLSDDAHAIRSSRLGEVEIHPPTREGYNERARNYWLRQKNMYQLVDMVMYISAMDQVAEEESYPFVPYYRLLRMPIRAFRILSKNMPAPMQDRTFLTTGEGQSKGLDDRYSHLDASVRILPQGMLTRRAARACWPSQPRQTQPTAVMRLAVSCNASQLDGPFVSGLGAPLWDGHSLRSVSSSYAPVLPYRAPQPISDSLVMV